MINLINYCKENAKPMLIGSALTLIASTILILFLDLIEIIPYPDFFNNLIDMID